MPREKPADRRNSNDRSHCNARGADRHIQAELQALKSGHAAPPLPPRDEGVRILQINNERTDGMPTLDQLRRLFSIVRTRVPQARTHDDDAPFRGFCGAYRFVSNCGRVAAPNARVTLGWWMDVMTTWLRERNAMTRDITGASFIAATMASGDVLFVPHNSDLGHTWEFSLVPPGHGGKPASADGWKRVLEGSLMAPSQPARQVRIVG